MEKHAIRRRSLLARLGAAAFLAAPVFRDVIAEAQSALPKRLVILHFPGGVRYVSGTYAGEFGLKPSDHNFNFSKVLSPLLSLRSDIVLLEQIGDVTRPGNTEGHTTSTLLTSDSRMADEDTVAVPPGTNSIDQVIANAIGQSTRFGSLQLGVHTAGEEAELTHARIVFANGTRVAPVNDPQVVFTRLFGGAPPAPTGTSTGGPAADQAAQTLARLNAQKRSILDLRTAELVEIRALVGTQEFGKLDEHLTAIRELENGIPIAGVPGGTTGTGSVAPSPGTSCGAPTVDPNTDLPTQVASMNELAYQALNCDLTRVVTVQWLSSGNDMTFPFLGVNRSHHGMQHDYGDDFDVVQTWFMSQAAAFIQRLKNTPEGSGSMLDNSAVFVVTEQSQSHCSTPTIGFIAGQAGGSIRTGGTLLGNQSSLADFHIGLARAFGVNLSTFGEPQWVNSPLSLG